MHYFYITKGAGTVHFFTHTHTHTLIKSATSISLLIFLPVWRFPDPELQFFVWHNILLWTTVTPMCHGTLKLVISVSLYCEISSSTSSIPSPPLFQPHHHYCKLRSHIFNFNTGKWHESLVLVWIASHGMVTSLSFILLSEISFFDGWKIVYIGCLFKQIHGSMDIVSVRFALLLSGELEERASCYTKGLRLWEWPWNSMERRLEEFWRA